MASFTLPSSPSSSILAIAAPVSPAESFFCAPPAGEAVVSFSLKSAVSVRFSTQTNGRTMFRPRGPGRPRDAALTVSAARPPHRDNAARATPGLFVCFHGRAFAPFARLSSPSRRALRRTFAQSVAPILRYREPSRSKAASTAQQRPSTSPLPTNRRVSRRVREGPSRGPRQVSGRAPCPAPLFVVSTSKCKPIDGASLSGVPVFDIPSSSASASTPHSDAPRGFARLALAASSYCADLSSRQARNASGVVSHFTMTFLKGQSRLLSTLRLTSSNPSLVRVVKSSTAFSARNGSSGGTANHSGMPTTSVP